MMAVLVIQNSGRRGRRAKNAYSKSVVVTDDVPPVERFAESLHLASLDAYNPLPTFDTEYLFANKLPVGERRKYRFDFALPDRKIALEVEGGSWGKAKSRHTTGTGYREDCRKYNLAALLGWQVYRFTSDMVASGEALKFVREKVCGSIGEGVNGTNDNGKDDTEPSCRQRHKRSAAQPQSSGAGANGSSASAKVGNRPAEKPIGVSTSTGGELRDRVPPPKADKRPTAPGRSDKRPNARKPAGVNGTGA